MYLAFRHQALKAWDRSKEVDEDFMWLSQPDQLTEGSPHFREQAEAWLADVLGEEAAASMVDRPRG